MCRRSWRLPEAGAAAGEGGAACLAEQTPLPAFHQQREMGGDAGGGRHEDGRVSRERERGVLYPHHHEHGMSDFLGEGQLVTVSLEMFHTPKTRALLLLLFF